MANFFTVKVILNEAGLFKIRNFSTDEETAREVAKAEKGQLLKYENESLNRNEEEWVRGEVLEDYSDNK